MDAQSDDSRSAAERDYTVPGLQRGLAILRLLGRDRPSITLGEIVRELGLPRATAFRLVWTLESEGYLVRAKDSSALRLGSRVLTLGFDYLYSQDLIEIARPVLEDLRDEMGASTHMGVLEGREVLYVIRAPSHQRLSSNRYVGSRLPAHSSSLGRALLLDHTPGDLLRLFGGHPMPATTSTTPTDPSALAARVAEERALGYVAGTFILGITSVAAPVRDASGRVVAAINLSDYESLPCMSDIDGRLKDSVLAAAADISARLGYAPGPGQGR